ncbi:hypothetical protein HAX54_051150 [Datura stramonium]|uniref:Uncharacterized protein n=1 Tax=Datura stramonium TaxID=4076 RepID=A0ABS8SXV8_DATST|nr:hypothetical protein [Datura stramonium]
MKRNECCTTPQPLEDQASESESAYSTLQLRRAGVEVLQRVPNGGSSNVVPNRGRDDSSEPSEKYKTDTEVSPKALVNFTM